MRFNSALRFYRENHYFLKLAMPSKNFISGGVCFERDTLC